MALSKIHAFTENKYLGLLFSSLVVFTLPIATFLIILTSLSNSDGNSWLNIILPAIAFFAVYWLWNKILLKYGFFQTPNLLRDDKKYQRFIPSSLLLLTPAIIFTIAIFTSTYIEALTFGSSILLWFVGFHVITWSWETILIKSGVFAEPRLIKHIAWIGLFFFMIVIMILDKPEPEILSNYKYRLPSTDLGAVRKAVISVQKKHLKADFLQTLANNSDENIDNELIASTLVNLDDDRQSYEAFFVYGHYEDCSNKNCDLYIFEASLPDIGQVQTESLSQSLGVIKQIKLPVRITDFPLEGWRNIEVTHSSGERKTYRFVEGKYQL